MPKLATAYVEITGKTDKYRSEVGKAKRMTDDFSRSATRSLKRITLGLGLLGAAAAAAAVAIGVKLAQAMVRVGRSTVQTALKYDKLKRGLLAVAGSAEEAERQLDRLVKVSELPGLSLEEAIRGSINLQAAGLSAELAERSLTAFGNALVTVGRGAPELGLVTKALTDITAKGKLMGQELIQMQNALPQIRQMLKKAFGTASADEIRDMGLSAQEFTERLVTAFEGLRKVQGGVANDLENLGISFDRLKDEIGKTLLGITGDSAKTLTNIIDDIRKIIPHWKKYKDDLLDVFGEISKAILEFTGEMMKGIGAIIRAAAPLLFKPLLHAGANWTKEFTTGVSLAINDLTRMIGLRSQEAYEKQLQNAMNWLQRSQEKAARGFQSEYDSAIDNMISVTTKRIPEIAAKFRETLGVIADAIGDVADKIPEAVATAAVKPTKISAMFSRILEYLEKVATAYADLKKPIPVQEVSFLAQEPVDPTARLREATKRTIAERENLDTDMQQRVDTNLTRWQSYLDEVEDMAQRVSNAISPIFENMFTQLFSGNTKNLWQEFWADLKRMAIRQMATIFATQIVGGLLTGGAGFALPAIGSAIGGNFGRGWGSGGGAMSAVGGGLGAAGKFLEGGMNVGQINFNEVDLGNIDRNRMLKDVTQTIGPALAENRGNGIE